MGGRPARVHDSLGYPLVIEVRDLLAKDEIFEQRWAPEARLERTLVGFWPIVGPPLPTLSEPFSSRTVLAPTIGSTGLTDAPSGGAIAAPGSYSAALLGLNPKAAATSCAPAAFSATMSPAPEASGFAGPLTVARLLRIVLLRVEAFDDGEDFAMDVVTARSCRQVDRDAHVMSATSSSTEHFVYQVNPDFRASTCLAPRTQHARDGTVDRENTGT
jgi:hypothetical protein